MKSGFTLEYLLFNTPLGWIIVAASPEGISLVDFAGQDKPHREHAASLIRAVYPEAVFSPAAGSPLLESAEGHILDYFEKRKPLPEIPVDALKGADFERRVWRALVGIPFGETRSYKEIAQAVGSPAGARAVGRACGRNPVPIIVPCHRVITAAGKLGGYSGGLHIKRALLGLERPDRENI